MRLQYTLPVEYGTKPAFDREEHRLVEGGQPLGRVAIVDEHPAERLERLGFEIGRPQTPTEIDDFASRIRARLEIAAAVGRLCLAQSQGPVLRRFRIVLERVAARRSQPPAIAGRALKQ